VWGDWAGGMEVKRWKEEMAWARTARSRPAARPQPRVLAVAPPPAAAGGGWEGVPTVRDDPGNTPPQPSPAFAGRAPKARGWNRSHTRIGKRPRTAEIAQAPARGRPSYAAWRPGQRDRPSRHLPP